MIDRASFYLAGGGGKILKPDYMINNNNNNTKSFRLGLSPKRLGLSPKERGLIVKGKNQLTISLLSFSVATSYEHPRLLHYIDSSSVYR